MERPRSSVKEFQRLEPSQLKTQLTMVGQKEWGMDKTPELGKTENSWRVVRMMEVTEIGWGYQRPQLHLLQYLSQHKVLHV